MPRASDFLAYRRGRNDFNFNEVNWEETQRNRFYFAGACVACERHNMLLGGGDHVRTAVEPPLVVRQLPRQAPLAKEADVEEVQLDFFLYAEQPLQRPGVLEVATLFS